MTEAAREAQRAYMQEWRKTHPDAIKRYRITYWERRAKKIAELESFKQDGGVEK